MEFPGGVLTVMSKIIQSLVMTAARDEVRARREAAGVVRLKGKD